MDDDKSPSPATDMKEKLIRTFIEATSLSRKDAEFFLEIHQWDVDAAVADASDFTENNIASATSASASASAVSASAEPNRILADSTSRHNLPVSSHSQSGGGSSDYIPTSPPSRATFRGPAGNIYTLADISGGTESDSDESQEYDDDEAEPERYHIMTIFLVPKNGEEDSDEPQYETHLIVIEYVTVWRNGFTIWRNGFTVDDNQFDFVDNPEDAAFLEEVERMEPPRILTEEDNENIHHYVKFIMRQEEDFIVSPPEPFTPFNGVGIRLSKKDSVPIEPPASSSNSLPPAMDLVVDHDAPTTSIQIRLADGTRIVSRFNTHHTVRDVRGFIDASRPDGSRVYQLLSMGFPPKPLTDFDLTIEEAGISNSVLIQQD
ncbi:hypothetical protein EUTSA_v10022118mg [Eutrema salsugineum]|uniref:UBX domain-containing protein n=1 Tax=Eutrema salsugineum TaxID=72664 RepID=V4LB94_EUTSA|nr:plant UBX domain-containing protein 5 [Eutrema salsugineum]ESQ47700.1 hypothetical protein EUTSA_v10022118mg [Eutrema salsugineum]